MIMDWVHCNNCYLLPDRDKCFFLTSCGHIFCRDCEATCAHDVCKLCGNQCTSIPLSSSMKPDVQMYFTDPSELLKAKLKEVQKISTFQKNHRARLMAYYRKELSKYRQMKDAFKKLLNNLKELESERKQLSKENLGLKKMVELSGITRTMTPMSSSGITPGGHGGRKGISPLVATPASSRMNPMFTQFFSKLDNSGTVAPKTSRVSVFSPPVNGKIGGIPASPSPSTALRNLNLSTHVSNQSLMKEDHKFLTPTCSQETVSEYNFNLNTESITSTPTDAWQPSKNTSREMYKKDPRRVVVHPFSPDE